VTLFSSLYTGRLDRELGTDDATQLFTTARRKAAVNEGLVEFAHLAECWQKNIAITIASTSLGEVDLHSTRNIPAGDFLSITKEGVQFVYYDASSNLTALVGDDLPRRDYNWLMRYEPGLFTTSTRITSTGMTMPQYYYLRKDGDALWLGFLPVPSSGSSATMWASVNYHAIPALLTSDSQEPYTTSSTVASSLRPYHQALVHYAAHALEKLRRDDQASDRQLQKFLGYVSRWLQNTRIKGGRAVMAGRRYFRRRA
jgi:hypothetical protein